MYAVGKGSVPMQKDMEEFVKSKSGYGRLGYIMPD